MTHARTPPPTTIAQFRVASVFAPTADAGGSNGDGDDNAGNGAGAPSAADEEGDSDAEHEWWPRAPGGGDGRGEVAGVGAERAEDAKAE